MAGLIDPPVTDKSPTTSRGKMNTDGNPVPRD